MKGIGLVGAILELDAAGYSVKRVAGTSAGAIVASIIAALNAKKQPLTQLHDVLNTDRIPAVHEELRAPGQVRRRRRRRRVDDRDGHVRRRLPDRLAGQSVGRHRRCPFQRPPSERPRGWTKTCCPRRSTPWSYTPQTSRAGNVSACPGTIRPMASTPATSESLTPCGPRCRYRFFFEPVRFRAPAGTIGGPEFPVW